ncbi:integrase [Deltaproteobacteria bacterium]|nr:integrase [Deltaproteobacteria bacterium]
MRIVPPLTDSQINAAKAEAKVHRLFDGHGLILEVRTSGAKVWLFQYGKTKQSKTLGRYPAVSLREARTRAEELRERLRQGLDPAAPAATETAPLTFGELAAQWRERFVSSERMRPATIRQKDFLFEKHILPALGGLPLAEITPAVILERLLRPLEGRGLLDVASRSRALIGNVFRFGIASGQTDKDPTLSLAGAVKPPSPKHRITETARLGEVLRAIWDYQGVIQVKAALKLLPLVFVRPGELRGWRWDEIDWGKRVWTIPAGRMKMNRPHVVPLARQVLTLLEELKPFTGPEGFLFPSIWHKDRPFSENALNAALRVMGFTAEEVVSHGFRTTASTLLNEQGNFRPDVIERSLSHGEKDAVRGAYNRAEYLDERRELAQWWADYLDKLRGGG